MAAGSRRVVWTDGAAAALDEAVGFIAKESPRAGAQLLARILEASQSLSTLSDRGRIVPETDQPGVRELLVDPYRLIYHAGEYEIVVLALLHQRQDTSLWKDRLNP